MHYYTPIIISKDGELTALSKLEHLDKTQTIPLMQFIKDPSEKRKGNYVDKRITPLVEGWSFLDNRLYFDASLLADSLALLGEVLTKLKAARINAIPVVHPDTPTEVMEIFKDYTYYGICLRFRGDNISATVIDDLIADASDFLDVEVEKIDLLFDFGYINKDNTQAAVNSFNFVYDQLILGKETRKIIVGAGSFPSHLGGFAKDTVTSIKRYEWDFWEKIKALKIKQTLVYADYGNIHPVYNPELGNYEGTCSIKYTHQSDFYVFRGERASESALGTKQYQIQSADLVKRPFYLGNTFSWGDDEILDRALKRKTPGGPPVWVKITQNHHYATVLDLLRP